LILKSLLNGALTAGLGIATGFTGASGKVTATFLFLGFRMFMILYTYKIIYRCILYIMAIITAQDQTYTIEENQWIIEKNEKIYDSTLLTELFYKLFNS
jgi:hypothetical protein